jgi:hypothetical protein
MHAWFYAYCVRVGDVEVKQHALDSNTSQHVTVGGYMQLPAVYNVTCSYLQYIM